MIEDRMCQLLLDAHDSVCFGNSNRKKFELVLSNCIDWIVSLVVAMES